MSVETYELLPEEIEKSIDNMQLQIESNVLVDYEQFDREYSIEKDLALIEGLDNVLDAEPDVILPEEIEETIDGKHIDIEKEVIDLVEIEFNKGRDIEKDNDTRDFDSRDEYDPIDR